jgi:hypothetical protein
LTLRVQAVVISDIDTPHVIKSTIGSVGKHRSLNYDEAEWFFNAGGKYLSIWIKKTQFGDATSWDGIFALPVRSYCSGEVQ